MKTFGDLLPGDVLCWRSRSSKKENQARFTEIHMIIGMQDTLPFGNLYPDTIDDHKNMPMRKYLLMELFGPTGCQTNAGLLWSYSWFNDIELKSQAITVIRS